jgi:hypothetical protein
MQRWAQTLISAHRTPLIDRYFTENPIPTDRHSYQALQIFWNYDLFSRCRAHHHGGIPRRGEYRHYGVESRDNVLTGGTPHPAKIMPSSSPSGIRLEVIDLTIT